MTDIQASLALPNGDTVAVLAWERRRIRVQGIVQGVGFRPFVFHLAQRFELKGWVMNNATGVEIQVEQEPRALDAFARALRADAPPLASIVSVTSQTIPLQGETTFRIAESHGETEKRAWISPDASICDDCLRELFNPADRRHNYAFINCTNCGPRFTIVKDVPYDRPFTTMVEFKMCEKCQREYDDPNNRRFHAQPNACPRCGPVAIVQFEMRIEANQDAMEVAARLLDNENILAVKGLGGFHLVCDATSEYAVSQLRTRKQRYDKPFALMVRDIETARQLCEIRPAEEALLTSRRRPIVLLRRRDTDLVAPQVAPHQNYLGLMLPYTPLHYVLLETFKGFKRGKPAILVMTSGNVSDEPIAYKGADARTRLAKIADHFLMHDREIHIRCDDSVSRIVDGHELLLRRSRGYVPEPLHVPQTMQFPLLATGAHLKNTFCVAKDDFAFVSHHIGDLENFETYQSFTQGIEHFKRLFDIEPQIIAHDMHPEYMSTKYALEQAMTSGVQTIAIQHHHAHIAAVMGEHGVTDRVIGVAFDGTGYGTDGTMWGGEFLVADLAAYDRVAHLATLPLLGGEQAIHEVWRLTAAWLYETYGDAFLDFDLDFVRRLDLTKWRVLKQMADNRVNAPRTSAMGRLFDAVASLINVRDVANYEAQAAIEMEMLSDVIINDVIINDVIINDVIINDVIINESVTDTYPFTFTNTQPRLIKFDNTLQAIITDLQHNIAPAIIAAKFHNTIAAMTATVCASLRDKNKINTVALGGGVFQNTLLLTRTLAALRAQKFNVLVPTQLPPNDGAIAYGQALIANARLSPP